nr:EAL domain-containing protein [Aliidiomarina sp.]
MPVAEQTGQIVEISHFVLDRSIAFLAQLNQDHPHRYVAVNLSVQLFDRIDITAAIKQLLEKYSVNPSNLHVELTESVFIEDFVVVTTVLQQLRELGVQVSLDDFGTGFSSLSMLHKLPIDIVKVDRSFVLEVSNGSESRKIAESVMLLAKTLNKKVIVEGIETKEQIAFSESFACDELQGFYFHKPVPANVILANTV